MAWVEALSFVPSALVSAFLLATEVRKRPFSLNLMHLTFTASFLVGFPAAQRALVAVPFAEDIPFVVTSRSVVFANGIVLAWLLAYAFGYSTAGPRDASGRVGALRRMWAEPLVGRGVFVATLLSSSAALVYLSAFGTRGIVTRGALEALAFGSTTKFLLITILIKMIPVAGTVVLLLYLVERRLWRSAIAISAFAALVYAVLLFANPLAGARFQTASVLIAIAAIIAKSRLRSGVAALGALLCGLFIGLPYLNVGRYAEGLDAFQSLPWSTMLGSAVGSGDFDAYAMLLATVWYVDHVAITWGRQILGVALFWVPRTWWENKPVGSGRVVAEYLGLPNTNVSSPLPAEAILNFGLLFVPVGALLFGMLARRVDDLYWVRDPHAALRRVDVAYPLWLGMVFFVSRGDLLSGFAYTVGISIAVLLVTLPLQGAALRRALLR